MIRLVLAAVLATAALPLWSQEAAPWDAPQAIRSEPLRHHGDLGFDLFQTLVRSYRSNQADTTVHRCLFDVSCSHFAERALSRYGMLAGTVVFIDRYFYRENQAALTLYPLRGEPDGSFLLDDGPFVP